MGISIWQIIIILLLLAIPVLVFGPAVKKAGFSRWWSFTLLLPIINVITIWVFAFIEWPAEKSA